MIQLEQLLSRLDHVLKNGNGWTARCPCHDDRRNSLSVSLAADGSKFLLQCFAGCPTEAIVAKLSLSWSDLFLQDQAPANGRGKRHIAAVYDYTDELGQLLYQNVRYTPKDFRLRRPNPASKDGWTWKLNGTRRVLYRLPEVLEAIALGKTIFLVEGEKDADRLWALGLAATTSGGAKSWKPEFVELLRSADLVIIPDRDRPGEDYARIAAQALQGIASSVQILILPLPWAEKNGLDVSDFLREHSAQELLALLEQPSQAPAIPSVWNTSATALSSSTPSATSSKRLLQSTNSKDLETREFPPVRWAVEGLIPAGLTLLCGKPKLGKSWMALSIGIAVAQGGRVLGQIPVEAGDVLYLALEDRLQRLQSRQKILLEGSRAPDRLYFVTECPRLGEGALEGIEAWLLDHPAARLIIIDTLAKIRPARGRSSNPYEEDYAVGQALKALADRHNVAMLVVHHLRKAESEDPLDRISGTLGLAGSADGTLILERKRGRADAFLHIDGRDIKEAQELGLQWHAQVAQWTIVGSAAELKLSQAQAAVIAALKAAKEPLGPKAVLAALADEEPDLSINAAKKRLLKMSEAGLLRVSDGKYSLPG